MHITHLPHSVFKSCTLIFLPPQYLAKGACFQWCWFGTPELPKTSSQLLSHFMTVFFWTPLHLWTSEVWEVSWSRNLVSWGVQHFLWAQVSQGKVCLGLLRAWMWQDRRDSKARYWQTHKETWFWKGKKVATFPVWDWLLNWVVTLTSQPGVTEAYIM